MGIGRILDTWGQVLAVDFLRYFLTAGPFYLLFWVWRPALLRGRRLQPTRPGRGRIASDFAYSLSTVLIFSSIGLSLVYAKQAGLTRIYTDVAERGWTYLVASVALAIALHDAYFYWTHRLLHWTPLYRLVHHVHHRSTSPTPWAAYAFHPIEALIQAGVYLLIVFALPIHPLALMLFLLFMIVRNVVGHLGFEILPAGFARHPLTRWHLTPTHHDQHHRWGRGNYGLYFSFWDDWLGTTRPDYVSAYDAVTARGRVRPAGGAAAIRVAVCVLSLHLPGLAQDRGQQVVLPVQVVLVGETMPDSDASRKGRRYLSLASPADRRQASRRLDGLLLAPTLTPRSMATSALADLQGCALGST